MNVVCEGSWWSVRIDPSSVSANKDRILNLYIYEDDSARLWGIYPLSSLYAGERELSGGRFQNYRKFYRENTISFPCTNSALFDKVLNWIAEKAEGSWSFSFHVEPDWKGYEFNAKIKMLFHFEDVEEAMLCRLSF